MLESRDISAAIVCFILSQDVKQVLDIWKRRAIHHIQRNEATREVALSDLLQKFILLKLALESAQSKTNLAVNDDFNQILAEIAHYMTSDEQAALTIVKYLSLSNSNSNDAAIVKQRIYIAHERALYGRVQLPQIPYQIERVRQ